MKEKMLPKKCTLFSRKWVKFLMEVVHNVDNPVQKSNTLNYSDFS